MAKATRTARKATVKETAKKTTPAKSKMSMKASSAKTGKTVSAKSPSKKTATRKPSTRKISAKTLAKGVSKSAATKRGSRALTPKKSTNNMLEELTSSSEAAGLTEQPKMRLSRKNSSKFRDRQRALSTPDDVVNPELRK